MWSTVLPSVEWVYNWWEWGWGFAPSCRLGTGRSEFRIPAGAREFCLLQIVQPGSGSHPAPYSAATGFWTRESSGHGVILTRHPHLALTVRTSRAVCLLLCAFMACTWPSYVPCVGRHPGCIIVDLTLALKMRTSSSEKSRHRPLPHSDDSLRHEHRKSWIVKDLVPQKLDSVRLRHGIHRGWILE